MRKFHTKKYHCYGSVVKESCESVEKFTNIACHHPDDNFEVEHSKGLKL
jgi:hypothetical protein